MALTATNVRLDASDFITAVRLENGSLSLGLGKGLTVEIPPVLAASLLAGVIGVLTPTDNLVFLHPKAQAVTKLFTDELPSDCQPPMERA